MAFRSSDIQDYIKNILNIYHEIQKANQNPDTLRVIETKQDKAGNCILKIQIIGKALVFECTPQEIVSNDKMLECFSKKEIRMITYLATQEIKKPIYKIYVQEFCHVLNKLIFKLGRKGKEQAVIKTADQISKDKEILNNLASEDAHVIGYTLAMEQMIQERNEMEKLKNENIK